VNLIPKYNAVFFFEDEDIPVRHFSPEELDLIEEGYTLIDRRENPSVGKCNFFDFMEEITSNDGC
jgi:hypothetical protein